MNTTAILPTQGARVFAADDPFATLGYEYAQILRSMLSEADREEVRKHGESFRRIYGHLDLLTYCEMMQQRLTDVQKASALERMELAYAKRGRRAHAHAA